jgi:hypothetical protein
MSRHSLSPTTVSNGQVARRLAIGTEGVMPREVLDGNPVLRCERVRREPSVAHLRKLMGQTVLSAKGTVEDRREHPLPFDDRAEKERIEVSAIKTYCGNIQVCGENLLGETLKSPNS